MSEWQPIETAPIKGTFLVWLPEPDGRMGSQVALMMNHPNVQFINGNFAFDLSKPTHWMPLPEPPHE